MHSLSTTLYLLSTTIVSSAFHWFGGTTPWISEFTETLPWIRDGMMSNETEELRLLETSFEPTLSSDDLNDSWFMTDTSTQVTTTQESTLARWLNGDLTDSEKEILKPGKDSTLSLGLKALTKSTVDDGTTKRLKDSNPYPVVLTIPLSIKPLQFTQFDHDTLQRLTPGRDSTLSLALKYSTLDEGTTQRLTPGKDSTLLRMLNLLKGPTPLDERSTQSTVPGKDSTLLTALKAQKNSRSHEGSSYSSSVSSDNDSNLIGSDDSRSPEMNRYHSAPSFSTQPMEPVRDSTQPYQPESEHLLRRRKRLSDDTKKPNPSTLTPPTEPLTDPTQAFQPDSEHLLQRRKRMSNTDSPIEPESQHKRVPSTESSVHPLAPVSANNSKSASQNDSNVSYDLYNGLYGSISEPEEQDLYKLNSEPDSDPSRDPFSPFYKLNGTGLDPLAASSQQEQESSDELPSPQTPRKQTTYHPNFHHKHIRTRPTNLRKTLKTKSTKSRRKESETKESSVDWDSKSESLPGEDYWYCGLTEPGTFEYKDDSMKVKTKEFVEMEEMTSAEVESLTEKEALERNRTASTGLLGFTTSTLNSTGEFETTTQKEAMQTAVIGAPLKLTTVSMGSQNKTFSR